MRIHNFKLVLVLALVGVLVGCGKEKTPNRMHMDDLKAALFSLQQSVEARNTNAIDSLVSGDLATIGPDSLLRYVYGPDEAFAFERFGNSLIAYTDDHAKIDCFIMDSTRSDERPVSFTLSFESDRWLFTEMTLGQGITIHQPDSSSE